MCEIPQQHCLLKKTFRTFHSRFWFCPLMVHGDFLRMIPAKVTQIRNTMLRCNFCRFGLCSVTSLSSKSTWDPIVSLSLGHPTLVLLEQCESKDHFKQILSQMIRLHLTTLTFPMSRLLYFTAISHPENLNEAILLFNHFTPHPNLYIYRIMISALSFSSHQSVDLYKSMLQSCIYPDEHTLLSLLKSNNFSVGKQTHVHVIVNSFTSHVYLQNSLIKMYLENDKIDLARQVFHHMHKKDIVSYNTMISGYSGKGYVSRAFESFRVVMDSGIEPDHFTMVALLMCCKQLKSLPLGKSIHGWIVRRFSVCGCGLVLSNALLDMYAKCEEMEIALQIFNVVNKKDCFSWNIIIAGFANMGKLDQALRFFTEAPSKDVVSWNSMLAGYAQKGDCRTVMHLFQRMYGDNVKPDKVTAVSLVSVAAEMGVLNHGRCAHGWVVKAHGYSDCFLGSAVIDMYCKCGSIEKALVVLKLIAVRDVTTWTAMITGLAFHGHGIKALELFSKMQEDGLKPNSVTLIAILTACSHSGLVSEGYRIFEEMRESYGVEPQVEHYSCLVDLLARSGRLNEALHVIERMPLKPSKSMWGAILSASRSPGNVKLAETALEELQKLEPEEDGGYVLMSNVYAAHGRWGSSDNIRENMGHNGVAKIAGCSSVVTDGVVHDFVASEKKHPRWGEIYLTLCDLHREMTPVADAP